MKKTKLMGLLFAALLVAYTTQSCQETVTEPSEFVATANSFSGFTTWTASGTHTGPSASLGPAHAGNDSTVTRNVFFKDGQDPVNGVYPVGMLIAKHTTNTGGTVAEYLGMAKRGNGFNPSHNDWEWFMLESNGTIMQDSTGMEMRGANLMNGMCNNCHSTATTDYSFAK